MEFSWSALNTNENLFKLRQQIEKLCDGWQVPICTSFTMQLTIDELVTNIVMHSSVGTTIWININRLENINTIIIKDNGPFFDPLMIENTDITKSIDERDIGGLGIFLIKEKSDTFTYSRKNNYNILNITIIDHFPQKAEKMKIEINKEDNITIVTLFGKLNSTTSGSLEGQLRSHTDSPASHLILDLAELDYMSSAGLRIMLLLSKKYKVSNWSFALCNMQVHVLEVFEMSGFDSFVDIEPNLAGAKEKVNS